MTRHFTQRRVAVVWGAVKWLPIVALPFGVFLFETWLQVQIYERGYAAAELRRKIRDVDAHIGRLQERADELTALKRVGERAPDLGLAPIQPGQIEVVFTLSAPEGSPAAFDAAKPIAIANSGVRHGSP